MKRILATSLAAMLLVIGGAPLPAAAAADAKGPACADITTGLSQSSYTQTASGSGQLYLEIRTVKPLCDNATLSVNLTDSTSGQTMTFTYPTDTTHFGTCGTNCISFTYEYPVAPTSVAVSLETRIASHVVDRAPSAQGSTVTFCLGGCPPSGSWDQ